VHHPDTVTDPDTGELISDAEVTGTRYTAFAQLSTAHEVTARLVLRGVKDKKSTDVLFPIWRHHAFLTDTTLSTVDADLTRRRHAIIEQVFADLIDGPLAHLPSGRFNTNPTWTILATITHNSPRAACCGQFDQSLPHTSPWRDPRRHLVTVPARLARPPGLSPFHTYSPIGSGRTPGMARAPLSRTHHAPHNPPPSTLSVGPDRTPPWTS
jgi:hypothetical protein